MTEAMSASTRRTAPGRVWPLIVVAVVLVAGGALYRAGTAYVARQTRTRVELPVALAFLPLEIGDWKGEDRPLTAEIEQVAGNDDYVNRVYVNARTGEVASLYVAYTARPRSMVGHRPQVCYVTHGWLHDGTQPQTLALSGGGEVPCLVHRFHQPPPEAGAVAVVNYYVLNGVVTNDESRFAGVGWRLPNIDGDIAYYVAQVQVSSTSVEAAKRLVADASEKILTFLPDPEGRVAAAEKDLSDR